MALDAFNDWPGATTIQPWCYGREGRPIEYARDNFSVSNDPSSSDDYSEGYFFGSRWINASNGTLFVCTSPGIGSAVWVQLASGSALTSTPAGRAMLAAADAAAQRTLLSVNNVDNTSDSNKPISIIQRNAITGIPEGAVIVFEGDSITTASSPPSGAGNDWPTRLMELDSFVGRGITSYNVATGGATLSGITTEYTSQVYPRRPAANGGRPAYLFLWIGVNDFAIAPVTWLASWEGYINNAKSDGFIVIAFTITRYVGSTPMDEITRQAFNDGIRLSTAPHYLVDTANLLPEPSNTSDYIDGLHPTAAANRKIAREVQSSVREQKGSASPDPASIKFINVLRIGQRRAGNVVPLTFSINTDVSQNSGFTANALSLDWTPTTNVSSGTAFGFDSRVFRRGIFDTTEGGGSLVALRATAALRGDGNIYRIVGFDTQIGSQTTAYGTGSGTVTFVDQIVINRPLTDASNPIGTVNGLLIEPQKITGVTTGVAIDQKGTTDLIFLRGIISITGVTTFASGTLITGAGSLATPALRFTSSATSAGIYTPNGSHFSIATNGILAVNWDNSGNLVNTGNGSFPRVIATSAANPMFVWYNTGAGANQKRADLFINSNGEIVGRLLNDAENSATEWLHIYRTAETVTKFAIPTGNFEVTLGNILVAAAGSGLRVKEGSNAKQGVATLVAGTVTVANTSVTANSRIFLTGQDNNVTGSLRVSARTASTSFTITSSNSGDTGVVAYEIFEPA